MVRPLLELQVRRLIRAKRLLIVAVTGSVGKTSTKSAIATVLAQKYRVLVHPGNFNAEIGLPLAVFDLDVPEVIINPLAWIKRLVQMETMIRGDYPYDLLVLELGTDHPGDIPHFMTYLKPDVGVVTAVTPEHMEFFKTLEAVAKEELSVAADSKWLVVNGDDIEAKWLVGLRWGDHNNKLRPPYYGLGEGADYRFKLDRSDIINGASGSFMVDGHAKIVGITLGVYSEPGIKAATAAYAVATHLGLTSHQIEAGLAKVVPVSGRMKPLNGLNGSSLIDDTYNSSPEAVLAALKVLAGSSATRRIAVMGSMNELGNESASYHEQVGAACADVDILVTIGDMANRYLGPAAIRAGLDTRNYKPADSPYAAGEFLKLIIKQGDVVLLKGSQNGVFAEEATKLLLADPHDGAKLVRQTAAWQAVKRRQFDDAV